MLYYGIVVPTKHSYKRLPFLLGDRYFFDCGNTKTLENQGFNFLVSIVPIACPWLKPLYSNTFHLFYLKSPGTVGMID